MADDEWAVPGALWLGIVGQSLWMMGLLLGLFLALDWIMGG